MKNTLYKQAIAISMALIPLAPSVSDSASLYRWEDENGKVFYSDKVPPEQSKFKREKLNTQGLTTEVVEAAKTKDQIEREHRLEQLRSEQRQLIEEQRDRDRVLLRTFRSEEELNLTLQGKLTTLDVLIKVTQANISRLETQLKEQLQKAAGIERNGRKTPKKLVDRIAASKRQLAENQRSIENHEKEKDRLREKFANYIKRFAVLTAKREHVFSESDPMSDTSKSTDSESKEMEISLVVCKDKESCDRAWQLAKIYVEKHSTTPFQLDTNDVLQTTAPIVDTDISVSVARINGKNDTQLFLDVHCKASNMGHELCASLKVRDILSGFKPFIEAELNASS